MLGTPLSLTSLRVSMKSQQQQESGAGGQLANRRHLAALKSPAPNHFCF